jgi:hypothetical protein
LLPISTAPTLRLHLADNQHWGDSMAAKRVVGQRE